MDYKKIVYALVILIVGIIIGYIARPAPQVEIKEKVVYKERIVRRTVKDTKPDGTVREVIDEVEQRDGSSDKKFTKANPKRFVWASMGVLEDNVYQVGYGYRFFPQVAVTLSVVSFNGDYAPMLGLQVDF